ncbi:hypothetical protein ACU4GR_20390 [Methylobacterium oryzae CBMB20]
MPPALVIAASGLPGPGPQRDEACHTSDAPRVHQGGERVATARPGAHGHGPVRGGPGASRAAAAHRQRGASRGSARTIVLLALLYIAAAGSMGALKLGLNVYRSYVSESAVRRLRKTLLDDIGALAPGDRAEVEGWRSRSSWRRWNRWVASSA